MNGSKEVMRMSSRRRRKAQIIITCFSLIVLIFVIYQILSSSNIMWKKHDAKESDIRDVFLDGYDNEGIYRQVFKHLKHAKSDPFYGEKLIHLDLKGAPPLVSYFREFFPYIKKLGSTGVLIEYEDMFFYNEELEDLRALNAYTPSDIKTILELAEFNDLSVIPLIQTFGHFEFVLKLEKFRHLREIDAFPQVLCPSHEEVPSVIHKMIDQVMKAHPKSKYIHIGSDEVMYLGKCGRCKAAMNQNSWNTSDLFLNHIKNIAMYIKKSYPGVRPIMWGDMIAKIDVRKLEKSQISGLVDVMVWKYVPNVSGYITNNLLEMYAKIFKNIWIASAFKGATGVSQIVTDPKYHLANHIAWMDIVGKWENYINFKGIALTGWQRYDHFAMLCELLPVAIPSLTVSMGYISESAFSEKTKILQCQSVDDFRDENCNFPGSHIFQLVNKFSVLSSKVRNHFSIMSSGWFSIYNIVHKFSSPVYPHSENYPHWTVTLRYSSRRAKNYKLEKIRNHILYISVYNVQQGLFKVKNLFEEWPLNEYRQEMRALEEDLKRALSEVYDEHTVKEWILTYVAPVRIRLEAFYNAKEAVMGQKVWPRRPLVNNTDDLERAAGEICTSERKFGCALLLI